MLVANMIAQTADTAEKNMVRKKSRECFPCEKLLLQALLLIICLVCLSTNVLAAPDEQTEKSRNEFVAEMTRIIDNANAAPNNNVIKFKLLIEEQIDQAIVALEKNFSNAVKIEFINDMGKTKNKIYEAIKLDIAQTKKELAIEVNSLIAKYREKINQDEKIKTIATKEAQTTKKDQNKNVIAEINNNIEITKQVSNRSNSDVVKTNPVEAEKNIAAEIARIISEINGLPNNNIVKFKVVVENETEKFLDDNKMQYSQKELAEMTDLLRGVKNKIYSDPRLNIASAKIEIINSFQEIGEKYSRPNKSIVNTEKNMAKINSGINAELAKYDEKQSLIKNYAVEGGGDVKNSSAVFAEKIEGLISEINKVPNNNIIKFKVTVDNETERFLTETESYFSTNTKNELANEMNNIKNKIYNNPKLKINSAKIELTEDYRRVEKKYSSQTSAGTAPSTAATQNKNTNISIVNNANPPSANNSPTAPNTTSVARAAARNNRLAATGVVTGTDAKGNYLPANSSAKRIAKPVTPEVYTDLIKQVSTVTERTQGSGAKVRISGGVRFHYAVNSGSGNWASNSSGLRLDVGAETQLDKDWRLYAGVSAKKSFLNFEDKVDGRFYLTKNIGTSTFRIGSFGYYMADGNIYDDSFEGLRYDFGDKIRYTVSYGNTRYTKDTLVATARYDDYDYTLEAGGYLFKNNADNVQTKLITFGGAYKFNNFSVGTMALVVNRKDANGANFGYVHSFTYGELKPWRKGTYNIWAKYYNQPKYTYIAPSMNGRGGWMQGFKGIGLGINYTFSENFVGSLEYYNLTDMTTGGTGSTWWGSLTHFF
jgi:hypothetical protein